MKKSELKALIAKNFKRSFEVNSPDMIRALDKKGLKDYINTRGGFSKGKIVKMNTIDKAPKIEGVPEGAIYIEAELSDESENMNGYVIEGDAWGKLLPAFFSDFGGFVLFQHIMENPIGKTLAIETREENGRKFLRASAYVRDEYTDKKLSRGLVSDISTGHIPLLIVYRNRADNTEMSFDDFWIMVDKMIDDMINEGKTFTEIRQAIEDTIAAYQERHREVQLVEYSAVTIGANKNAEIKTIKNKLEIIKNEIPEEDQDKPIENDEKTDEEVTDDKPAEITPEVPEVKSEETPAPVEGEQPATTTIENTLKNEGGNPEDGKDTPDPTPENGGEPEDKKEDPIPEPTPEEVKAENATLKSGNETLKNQVTVLEADKTKLENDVKELKTFNNGRKKVAVNVLPTSDEVDEKKMAQLKSSCTRLLNQVH